jgi:large subunit ribosomal protein L4
MQLELLNEQGQAASKVEAAETVFGREFNEDLVHQVVTPTVPTHVKAPAPRRTVNKCVTPLPSLSSKKGTGRARAGMSSPPLWRGGGRIFPNLPEENFSQKINKKMYRAGMASILSLAREGRLAVVESLTLEAPRPRCWQTSSRL